VTAAMALSVLGLQGSAGCRHALEPMPELEGGIELALRRGSAWQTIKVRPPYVIGPTASLKLNKGNFVGMSAAGDLVHIQVKADGALGMGPGRVDIDFERDSEAFVIEGVWNDARVHFRISDSSFRGSLRGNNGFCQYTLDETLVDGARRGISICSGLPEETRLEIPLSVQKWLTSGELAIVMLELLTAPPTTTLERNF
jgi:hypothetical protein